MSAGVPIKTVLLGNPGVGKSTIHNTLLGKISSQSGLSFGTGLTQKAITARSHGFTCVDTPGLADIDTNGNTFAQISNALRGPCRVRLVFVATLEGGRVRKGDVASLACVLDGLSGVVPKEHINFMLIINKCPPQVYEQLSNKATYIKARSHVLMPFYALGNVSHFAVLKFELSARGKRNVFLENVNVKKLRNWIEQVPTLDIPHDASLNVNVQNYKRSKMEMGAVINNFYIALGKHASSDQDFIPRNCDPTREILKSTSQHASGWKRVKEFVSKLNGKAE
ncbi:unnamed protein product, partial [Agarophyton chilense]